jgi:UDP-N-acetylglucosamine:LPS N-acetylglucosamine transferase
MRQGLKIKNTEDPVILVMGGGEGVGSLGEIVEDTVAEVRR